MRIFSSSKKNPRSIFKQQTNIRAGVGFSAGAGCGFGIGWGFGGVPIGFLNLGVGGGCGVGIGLGWGIGTGLGTEYINISPQFTEGKSHRPNLFQQLNYAFKRLSTLTSTPPPKLTEK